MKRPLVIIGFIYFIALLLSAVVKGNTVLIMVIISFVCLGISLFVKVLRINKIIPITLLTLFIAFTAFWSYTMVNVQPVQQLDGKDATIVATLCELPTESYGRYYYTLETESIDIEGSPQNIKISTSTSSALDIKPYDHIKCNVYFYSSRDDENGLTTKSYYNSKGIYIQSFMYEYEYINITPATSKPIYYYALQIRQTMVNSINNILPVRNASLINGVLLGATQGISSQTIEDFRIDGVTHILSVSGIHMAVIAQLLLSLFLFFKIPKKWASAFTILGVLLFMTITGFVPTVMRAGMMTIILHIGIILTRESDTLNSLAISILIMCLVNPLAAGDIGLILSFSSTLGLILFSNKFSKFLNSKTNNIKYCKKLIKIGNETLATTFSATIFTIPFIITSFGQISLIAPLGNLLIVYPSTIMMIFSIVASLSYIVGALVLAMPFGFIAGLISEYILKVSNLIAKIPYAAIPVKQSFMLLVIAGILILTAVTIAIGNNRKVYKYTVLMSVLILLFGITSYQFVNKDVAEVSILNSGNGVCLAVTERKNSCVVSCGGGNISSSKMSSYLKNHQVNKLDFMLVPNKKDETSLGSSYIIQNFAPEHLFINDINKIDDSMVRATENADNIYDFKDKMLVNVWGSFWINSDSSGAQNYTAINIKGIIFLICSGGGDILDIPEDLRSCDVFICSSLPSNLELLNTKHTILSMNQDKTNEAIKKLLINTQTSVLTTDRGDINIKIDNKNNLTITK